jgi:hypothetical protein
MIRRRLATGKLRDSGRALNAGGKRGHRNIQREHDSLKAACFEDFGMKTVLCSVLLAGVCSACSGMQPRADDAQLAFYRAHAGSPVASFHSFGGFDSWEPLGDEALAVWTHPKEAWLLDLYGPCNGLDFSIAIGVTQHVGQVEAGFDEILVDNPSSIRMPCRIRSIRPLDVHAVQKGSRNAQPPAAGQ